MGHIQVLMVEDHELFLDAIRYFFEQDEEIDVVGETGNGDAAIEMARRLRPDVVVTDIDHAGADGFEVTRRILEHDPDAKVLVHSGYDDLSWVEKTLELGARGYVLKCGRPSVLIGAIKTIAGGGEFVSPALAAPLAERASAGWKARRSPTS